MLRLSISCYKNSQITIIPLGEESHGAGAPDVGDEFASHADCQLITGADNGGQKAREHDAKKETQAGHDVPAFSRLCLLYGDVVDARFREFRKVTPTVFRQVVFRPPLVRLCKTSINIVHYI